MTKKTEITYRVLVSQIRDMVNRPWVRYHLLKTEDAFYQICACMDVLEDTQTAIETYRKMDFHAPLDLYLPIYGVLQAVYMQQDAVISICNALGLDSSVYKSNIGDIRKIRDDLQHPTCRCPKGARKRDSVFFIQLEQFSLNKEHCRYLVSSSKAGSVYRDINISKTIDDQTAQTTPFLEEIIQQMKKEFIDHCQQCSKIKLRELLAPGSYNVEKICEQDARIAKNLGSVPLRKILKSYSSEIALRYSPQEDRYGIYETRRITRILELIESGTVSTEIVDFLKEDLVFLWRSLEACAKEIDQEFETCDGLKEE